MHVGVRSAPVPGGVHLQKAAKTNRSTQVQVHASRVPFFTCPRRCALAEGCKNEPQHACISACISASVRHLCPEVCTCRRRKYQQQHAGTSACISGSVLHLCPEVCTCRRLKNEPQHAGISACISGSVRHLCPEVCTCRRLQKRTAARGLSHKLFTLGGRCAGGVPLQERQMQGLCSDPSRCVCADGGSIKNAKCND